jgi:L-asparaginase/Glu-tRNA(Gln) amidotransferase subunit D
MAARKVKWFTTGGTIDSQAYSDPVHPPRDATNDWFSYLPLTLQGIRDEIRPDFPIELEQMWTRDSKYIRERDIEKLAARIRADKKHDVFVVTHGTDTMPENSRTMMKCLNGFLKEKNKTVIFTGSMLPLANGETSDGLSNLRFIIGHFDDPAVFPPGVHVVMHAQVFSPVGLRKDLSKREFYCSGKEKDLKADARAAGLPGSAGMGV